MATRNEDIMQAILDGDMSNLPAPQSRNEALLQAIGGMIGEIGEDVEDKLDANQGAANAGKIMGIDNDGNVVPVPGSQGGTPSAGDIPYSDQAAYDDGSVGKAVSQLKSDFAKLGLSVVDGKLCMTYTVA